MGGKAMTCGQCKWFDADAFLADPNDPPEDRIGVCGWPSENLPYALRYGARERVAVIPVDGEGCKCFEQKEGSS